MSHPTGLFEYYSPAPQWKVGALLADEAEAKRRMSLWINFLDPGPTQLDVSDHLAALESRKRRQRPRGGRNANPCFHPEGEAEHQGDPRRPYASSYILGFPVNNTSDRAFAKTFHNYNGLFRLFGCEDHICIYPRFFDEGFNHQVGLFVHELSHLCDNTGDNYDWIQPSRNIWANAHFAQLYEKMGTDGRTSVAVKLVYWSWIDAAEH